MTLEPKQLGILVSSNSPVEDAIQQLAPGKYRLYKFTVSSSEHSVCASPLRIMLEAVHADVKGCELWVVVPTDVEHTWAAASPLTKSNGVKATSPKSIDYLANLRQYVIVLSWQALKDHLAPDAEQLYR